VGRESHDTSLGGTLSTSRLSRRRTGLAVLLTVPTVTGALLIAPGVSGSATAAASTAKGDKSTAFYDAREGESASAKKRLQARQVQLAASPQSKSMSAKVGGQSVVEYDPLTGTPRHISRLDGYLTPTSSQAAPQVVLAYVRAHAADLGLTQADIDHFSLGRDYKDIFGGHHVSFVQLVDGVPLFGNGLKGNVTASGRLINIVGSPVSNLAAPAGAAKLTASQAVVAAKKDVGSTKTAPTSRDATTKVLFQTTGGTRKAWRVVAMSLKSPVLSVIDAENGRTLYRSPLASDASAPTTAAPDPRDALALVFDNYPGAPKGGTQRQVNLTGQGWLPKNATTLDGNNTHTYTDVNDDNVANASEEVHPVGTTSYKFPQKEFTVADEPCAAYPCTWDPEVPNSWKANRAQTAVQNFTYINVFHDHLAASPIGFTEAAGNFQKVNKTGLGAGGDAIEDQPLDGAAVDGGLPDGSHIDNANFATPPDGIAPTMQMYLFHQPGFDSADDPFVPASGADEAGIVYHEFTHGLSHRLIVDATNVPAMDSTQGGSMGEAWSDWYAMDMLVGQGLIKDTAADGDVRLGEYTAAGQDLYRTQPLDCTVGSKSAKCTGGATPHTGGYTYGDFGKVIGRPEVHADGEIWAETLWQLRGALGQNISESIITRAMELSPTFPSMLDARNSILEADLAYQGGKHLSTIWKVFAQRGMGWFAGTVDGDDTHPVENFSLPPAPNGPKGTVSGTVTDAVSGAPLAGAAVAIGGHDSGFAGSFAAISKADGSYTITSVPVGTYPDLSAVKPGFDTITHPITIGASTPKQSFALLRDWAAIGGGGSVLDFDGVDYSDFGCGPTGAIDQSLGTGWGSTSDLGEDGLPTTETAKSITIALPKAVNVTSIVVDPNATCGDAGSSSTADYKVETYDGTAWHAGASGTFGPADRGRLNAVALAAGAKAHITRVRFTMITPQVFEIGGSCPGDFTGCDFLDMSELEVYGTAAP
jgi:extracellular elastinolytic metalloproteinase